MGNRTRLGIGVGAALAGVAFAIVAMRVPLPVHDGQRVYDQSCAGCHDVGAHGAPRAGNRDEWALRLSRGERSLYDAALHGKTSGDRLMPPRGGNPRLSDAEVKGAVDYLVTKSR